MRLRAIGIVVVLMGLVTNALGSESSRLLFIDPDHELESAVRATLSGWDTVVVVEMIAGPGSVTSGSVGSARLLAKQRRAQTVAWISRSDGGFALWLYDAQADRAVSRALSSPPPFDEATAASVALSVKTLLRHGEASPPADRPVESREHWLRIAAALGMRSTGTVPRHAELRFGLGASVWPTSLSGPMRLGFGLDVASGPGVAVQTPTFTGRWNETSVLFSVRGLVKLHAALDVGFAVGAGFDVTSLEGTTRIPPREAREARVNGIAGGQLELGFRPGPAFRLLLRPGLVYPFNRQTYFVDGEPVIRMERVILSLMAGLEVGLF